jgi:broad specificity phosphatase PhoE
MRTLLEGEGFIPLFDSISSTIIFCGSVLLFRCCSNRAQALKALLSGKKCDDPNIWKDDDPSSSYSTKMVRTRKKRSNDLHLLNQQQDQATSMPSCGGFRSYPKPNVSDRLQLNASTLPRRLILLRHGQSAANVLERLYAEMPDNAIPLTELGWEQAQCAGRQLRQCIVPHNETIHFIVSPYVRTMETFHGIVSAWHDPQEVEQLPVDQGHSNTSHNTLGCHHNERQRLCYYTTLQDQYGITWQEDPRIREQDFGNYQDLETIQRCKKERDAFGIFYYRFPHGESATDVYDRVSTFLDSLWRKIHTARCSQNTILVTHGIAIRVFLARYFRYSVDQFHELKNPKNCEMFLLEHNGSGALHLKGRYELQSQNDTAVTNHAQHNSDVSNGNSKKPQFHYQFHSELRKWPETWMKQRRRVIRLHSSEQIS